MNKFAIFIPTYHRRDLLISLLESIDKYTNPEIFEVWVLNNSHNDLVLYPDYKFNYHLVRMENNLGNIACNYAVKWASDDCNYIIILNDDVEITGSGWIEKLYSYFEKKDKVGIAGPQISKVRILGNTFVPGGPARIDEELAFIESWCIMLPRQIFQYIGGFSEDDVKVVYGEDFDLCMKIKHFGYKMVQSKEVPIKHLRFGTTRASGSPVQPDKLCADNLKRLYNKWVLHE